MKEKIKKAISKNSDLQNEDNNIDNSYIMTFDAFILFLVKKYHYLLNLDKNINIIDSSVLLLKKQEIIKNIFKNNYLNKNKSFVELILTFCAKNDKEMQRLIINIDKNLDLLIEKENYLKQYIDSFYTNENIDLIFDSFNAMIFDKIENIKETLIKLSDEVNEEYYNKIEKQFELLFNVKLYDDLKIIQSIDLPNLPRGSSDNAKLIKSQLKNILDYLLELTKKNKAELINQVMETKNHMKEIIDILIQLNKEVYEFKKNNNSFEFIDLSRFAISLLENNPNIAKELTLNFKEIMIDEFQDTNDIQEKFISLIKNNNVYMVGDIKQSIYRFRNANPIIFKNIYNQYKNNQEGFKIDLNKNFRSRSEVIKPINIIFNMIMDDKIGSADYVIDHQMVFGKEAYNLPSTSNYNFEIYNYEPEKKYSNDELEAFLVAKDIKKKLSENFMVLKNDQLVPASYSDFCILIDRTTSFDIYKKMFDYMQIPLNIYKDDNILLNDETMLIKNIISFILKIKNKTFDQEFKFYYTSIARSYLYNKKDEEIFLDITKNNIFNSEIFKICQKITEQIDYISNKNLIEQIISDFNFYKKMISVGNLQERELVLNNILEKSEELNRLGMDIYQLEDYFNILIENNIEITVPALLSDKDAVTITNIHKSKGLEYHICYYCGLAKKFNLRDSFEKIIFSKDFGFIIPNNKNGLKNTFIYALYKEKYLEDEISEKIRLFYVALTRCKEKIIMLTSFNENKTINNNNNIVDYLIRMSYRSFLDILYSVYEEIEDNITKQKTDHFPSNYLLNKKISENIIEKKEEILVNELEFKNNLLTESNFSKKNKNLFTIEEMNNIIFGEKIHYILENIDFLNPSFDNLNKEEIIIIKDFLNHPILKNMNKGNIIKEYEFNVAKDNLDMSGVIDLLIEYEDHIDIIDYKLKNIKDKMYIDQLKGYKNYIYNKTKKKTNIYLYSLLDKNLVKID
ncbi:MAG: UvrD-helicase domain-containing protein, partial [Bacilli bacterium]|nr:UvrD-helicase domain-containing protein [Bacilli bacterium]